MPDTPTVFRAEIEAISHACHYILANPKKLDINYIKILSESQAAIKALNKPRFTSQSVLTALEYIGPQSSAKPCPVTPYSFIFFF